MTKIASESEQARKKVWLPKPDSFELPKLTLTAGETDIVSEYPYLVWWLQSNAGTTFTLVRPT